MDRGQVASLLEELRATQDKATMYRKLVKIRMDVIGTEAGVEMFYSLGGIRLLVALMSKPYEKVLEVVLSILGNTCMRKDCAKQAHEHGILTPLISIISNIPNPAIQCRGCRLLGNLAQFPAITYVIGKDCSNTAYALTSILSETNNTAVLIMAIRAIRQLWNEKAIRSLMISQGCIKKIVGLLLKFARNEAKALECTSEEEPHEDETEKVVIKRMHAPDRTVTREKFKNIVRHMENSHHCDIVGYQVIKSYRWKDSQDFKMPEAKETVELFIGILKCLQMVTTTISAQVAQEVYDENGCGMKCVVFLCSETSQFRALALKIIFNLASNPDAIDKLTACDVITMASDLIMYANLDDSEKRFCTSVICLLAKEACNRGHIRRSGALQALMKLAKQCFEKRELSMILYALYQYRFDNLSFDILLSNGLVSFLVGVLNDIISEKQVNHIKHDDEETMNTSVYSKRRSSSQKASQKKRSDELFNYKGSNYYRQSKMAKLDPYCSAPESPESGYASTSTRNPSSLTSSPARIDDLEEDLEDNDIYSPVCSDAEEEEPQENPEPTTSSSQPEPADEAEDTRTTEFDILAYLYDDNSNTYLTNEMAATDLDCDGGEEEDPPPTTAPKGEKRLRNQVSFDDTIDDNEIHDIELEIVSSKAFEKNAMQPILTLLWSISKSHRGLEFVQPDTLATLLKICKLSKKPRSRAYQIIANIIKHVDHFLPLLKQDFVFRLHEFKLPHTAHSRCWSCDEMKSACNELMSLFGNIAETGYGQGEIAHILRTAERTQQLQVSIIVTFVIRDSKLLHKLLFDMKILNTVMNIILNENDEGGEELHDQRLSAAACSGITTLAQNLSICGEEEDTGTPSETLEAKEFDNTLTICDESSAEEKVTFKVTNAAGVVESVRVNKSLLIQGSDVFERMFDGDHFVEAKNNEVHLREAISVDGLRYFFYLIRLQTVNKLTGMAPPPKAIGSSLDALSLSQKYMLPAVERSVQNIIKTLLNDDCVLNVFEWSLKNYNQELLVASTYYFLYADISGAAKCKLFRAANKSPYQKEWRRLMNETILFRVQPNLE
uniref:ARMC5-like ARM-repeats domain-containing protein n=1 Tax=Culex tarsalis TaxID=7177 RepID=A0A1Q3EYU2_CULTA